MEPGPLGRGGGAVAIHWPARLLSLIHAHRPPPFIQVRRERQGWVPLSPRTPHRHQTA